MEEEKRESQLVHYEIPAGLHKLTKSEMIKQLQLIMVHYADQAKVIDDFIDHFEKEKREFYKLKSESNDYWVVQGLYDQISSEKQEVLKLQHQNSCLKYNIIEDKNLQRIKALETLIADLTLENRQLKEDKHVY